ncbi:MAG: hypothetical protein ACPLPR_03280 [Bacillota bacterium]
MAILKLQWQEIQVNRSEALRYLGYRQGVSLLSEAVEGLLREGLALVEGAARPAGSFSWCEVDPVRYKLSEKIKERVRGAVHLVCFSATLGADVDKVISQLFLSESHALAAVTDAWGSAGAEAVARRVQLEVGREARQRGLIAKFRLSPGYSGWPLEANHVLLQDSHGWELGIQVRSEGLLLPRKSVLGIIPLFPAEPERGD